MKPYKIFFLFLLLSLTACGSTPVALTAPASLTLPPTDAPSTSPAPTAKPTVSTPTETLMPTSAETPEVVFVPEGFKIGPGGLLRNPDGKDVLAFNPEADWGKFQQIIRARFYEIGWEWYKYTGIRSDVLNYSFEEEFIKAAQEGNVFNIGIPVRVDGSYVPNNTLDQREKDRFVELEMVNVSLNDIQIQILAPEEFKQFTGKNWQENGQKAYDCISYPGTGSNVILFSTNETKLVISVGSFYSKSNIPPSFQGIIGDFNPELYEKYPTYFRPNGIGVKADRAASFILGIAIDEFEFFSLSHFEFTGTKGNKKYIAIGPIEGYPDQENHLNPYLFVFKVK